MSKIAALDLSSSFLLSSTSAWGKEGGCWLWCIFFGRGGEGISMRHSLHWPSHFLGVSSDFRRFLAFPLIAPAPPFPCRLVCWLLWGTGTRTRVDLKPHRCYTARNLLSRLRTCDTGVIHNLISVCDGHVRPSCMSCNLPCHKLTFADLLKLT